MLVDPNTHMKNDWTVQAGIALKKCYISLMNKKETFILYNL